MKKFIRFLLVLMAGVLLRAPVFAQSYPVQATVQLTPPYSLYLADYTAPGSNRILANILLKDLSRQDLQTRLRLSIEGVGVSITTSPNFRPAPLYLQGGLPIMLTAADLAPYFNPDNLIFQGISKQEVQKGGTLPEGLYRICIQVLDYNLNAEVSNQACGTAWLILNDPPIINLPSQGEKLRAQEPQNIVFQWTPRHTGSPNAAFSTEYDFQLVELWPDNRDPNNAILSSPPIYETTTFSTSLIYGPAETPLEPGRKYAFRVRARAMTGIEEMNLFKNNGYSEVYSFTYGDACTAPGVVSATTVSSSRVEVRWESAPFHTEFTVRYREKSKRGAKWQEKRTYLSDLVVDGLLPQTEYEFQVLGICGSLTGAASETVSMITSEEPLTNFTCGAGPDAFDLENQDPLQELQWGDVFKAGDVEVTVLNVKGGNGTFSGTGLAEMPWLRHVKLRVDYSGVFINNDYQLVRGSVNSVFNPESKMIVNLDGLDELFGGGGEVEGTDPVTDEEIAHEGEIADVTIDPTTGAIVVIDEDGKETAYPEEKDEATGERKSVKIVDSSGDTWIVDKNGNVSKGVGSNGAAPVLATTDEPLDFVVQFAPNERQLYGFDSKNDDAFNNYEKAQLQDEEYPIAWKSIEAGRVDYVNATADGKTAFPGFIGFKTPTMPMASQPADKEAGKQVNLVGGIAGQTDQLIAFALKEDEKGNEIEHELGVLNLVSYAKVRNKVVLVPVNGATVPANVKQEINAVFAQSVAEWDVVIDAAYTVDPSVLEKLDEGESGMLASFPKNMRDFIQTFKSERDEDKNAYYLFIIPGKQSTRAGFMPFKRQFGFIYPANTNNSARTIAHELGHGAFRLRHTFSPEAFIAGQGKTNNLMDYPAGSELRKYQWDNVHEPESMSGWFEDDAEVAYTSSEYFAKLLQEIRCAYASGITEIAMPEKFINGGSNVPVAGFDYGLPTPEVEINGLKIRSALWTALANKTTIKSIKNPVIDAARGEIKFTNFSIKLPVEGYNMNGGVTPFEHFRNYLFANERDILAEFDRVWNDGVRQKIEGDQEISYEDIRQLKAIASCATKYLDVDSRYKLVQAIMNYSTREYYEDLILDVIQTTPAGNEAKDLFTKINSNVKLLDQMIRSMDNLWGDEKNFDRLAKEYYLLFTKGFTQADLGSKYAGLTDDRKLFFYGFGQICEWSISATRNENVLAFEEKQVSNVQYRTYNPTQVGSSVPLCDVQTDKYSIPINDFVAVKFVGENILVKEGETLVLPASVYYILVKSYWNEQHYQAADAAWLAVGLVTPIDEFYLLGKAIQYSSRGIKALRFGAVKILAKEKKIIVPLTENGKELKKLSEDRKINLNNYVDWDDVSKGADVFELTVNGKLIGKFSRGNRLEIIDDITLHGGNTIGLSPNKTTTITGTLDDVNLVAKRGVNADETFNGITAANVANAGGINILRSPKWGQLKNKYKTVNGAGHRVYDWEKISDEFWETVNKPWLDEAITRGDNLRLVSNPSNTKAIYVTDDVGNFVLDSNGNKIKSIFGREVDYLKSNGYTILSDGTAIK